MNYTIAVFVLAAIAATWYFYFRKSAGNGPASKLMKSSEVLAAIDARVEASPIDSNWKKSITDAPTVLAKLDIVSRFLVMFQRFVKVWTEPLPETAPDIAKMTSDLETIKDTLGSLADANCMNKEKSVIDFGGGYISVVLDCPKSADAEQQLRANFVALVEGMFALKLAYITISRMQGVTYSDERKAALTANIAALDKIKKEFSMYLPKK